MKTNHFVNPFHFQLFLEGPRQDEHRCGGAKKQTIGKPQEALSIFIDGWR
jgi:hypothetical protein